MNISNLGFSDKMMLLGNYSFCLVKSNVVIMSREKERGGDGQSSKLDKEESPISLIARLLIAFRNA